MNCIRSITAIAALLALSTAAAAQTIPDNVGKSSSGLPAQLQNIGFEPQLNAQLPLDVNFRDESGRDVQLREYFGRKPVVLALVYYGCPMLCNQVEMGVVGSLKMLSFNAGRDYEVIFVSFDTRETPDMAAKKKVAAVSRYARPETASRWPYLALFLRRRIPFPRCASRLGRRFRWKNRNAHRPSAALLLSI